MRVESVTAHAFGPLAGQTLDLAPGMTVIVGANESAKSSWHAALYAAMCGARRGRGGLRVDERRFAELHKPWDGNEWRVSAVIVLDGGRRIEMTQDLEGRVDCRATDLVVGSDVSAEVMWQGGPDASRWLGLERKSFAATACVNQAQLLSVLEAANGLQEYLQRAAATAGTDATAASALECLDTFLRDNVGQDRANSTKPLRAAKDRLARSEAALAEARRQHEQYLDLLEDARRRRDEASKAAESVRTAVAAVTAIEELLAAVHAWRAAQRNAEQAQEKAATHAGTLEYENRRLARINELHARFGGQPPAGLTGQEELARTVDAATAAWQAAPSPRQLTGPTSQELQAELDDLPAPPTGDVAVDPDIRAHITAHEQALAVASAHEARRPRSPGTHEDPQLRAATTAGPAALRDFAAALSAAEFTPDVNAGTGPAAPNPGGMPALAEAVNAARASQRQAAAAAERAQQVADTAAAEHRELNAVAPQSAGPPGISSGSRRPLLLGVAVGSVATVLGLVLVLAGLTVPGVAILIATVIAAGAYLVILSRATRQTAPTPGRPAADAEAARTAAHAHQTAIAAEQARRNVLAADRLVAECEGRHFAAVANANRAEHARAEVAAQCAARDLPADPAALRILAAQAEQLAEARTTFARWDGDRLQYAAEAERAATRLRAALLDRGVADATNPEVSVADAVAQYEADCAARARQAAAASRRAALTQALTARLAAESNEAEAQATRSHALDLLRGAVQSAGADTPKGPDAEPAQMLAALAQWQTGWNEKVIADREDQQGWSEFVTLLDGSSMDELSNRVAALREEQTSLLQAAENAESELLRAKQHRDDLASAALVDSTMAENADTASDACAQARDELIAARGNAERLAAAAENAEGALAERARSLPNVPETEEALAAAKAELTRVTDLETTLRLTHQFLSRAQEQVHRDIAPKLAATLRTWLPEVTEGRYVDATVDPATLHVQVCGPSRRWRHADRLSVGTAEQVYLLLRIALAQHLTAPDETCPLLLDDVTVQADDVRSQEVLDLLLRLSEQRQIVLFSQEPVVQEWARTHLDGDRHALRELVRVAAD